MTADVTPLIDAYLTHLSVERRLALNSIESYARDLNQLARFAAGHGRQVEALQRPDLERFVRDLMAEGRSPRSVAREVACVRGFYRFLVIDGRLPASPADDLHPPRAWQVLPKYLSIEEVDALIAQPDVSTPRGLRDRALIELLYATGARISEIVGLSIGDIEFDAGLVRLFGKGAKERIVPFGGEAARALDEWFSERGRAHLVPMQWRRRSDAEAVFLNTRGSRLTRQAAWLVVRKYGEVIGRMTAPAVPGEHVHVHNLASLRAAVGQRED